MELTEGWFALLMIISFFCGAFSSIVLKRDEAENAWIEGYKRGVKVGEAKNDRR